MDKIWCSLQVFAADGRTLLRQLKGHQQAVHVVQFSLDRLHIFSGGDDATVSPPQETALRFLEALTVLDGSF